MDLADFDYHLPASAIAQEPAAERDGSRLLRLDRRTGRRDDRRFSELPALLSPGDCLVVNDSRVVPARVLGRDGAGRPVELLFLEHGRVTRARALVRPGRRCRPGAELTAGGQPGVRLRVLAVAGDGARLIERLDGTIEDLLTAHGQPPLPPYLERHAKPGPEDWERYQTIYAGPAGSVAAPTAGLHVSPTVLGGLSARGVEVHALTLHVGPATFQPIRAARVEDHVLAPERVSIPPAVAAAVRRARAEGRRVVAVGTTTARALEGRADGAGGVEPGQAAVGLFIRPGHRFQVVDALLTNFHLPRSSLLVLVSAFAGREVILAAYRHALASGYRFYSYGDATLIE